MWDKHLRGYKKAEKQTKNSERWLYNSKLQFIKVRLSRYWIVSPGGPHMLLCWHWLSISCRPLTKLLWGAGLLHPQAAVFQLRLRLPLCFNTLFPVQDDFAFQLNLHQICNSYKLKYFSWHFEYVMAFTERVKWQVITETTLFGKKYGYHCLSFPFLVPEGLTVLRKAGFPLLLWVSHWAAGNSPREQKPQLHLQKPIAALQELPDELSSAILSRYLQAALPGWPPPQQPVVCQESHSLALAGYSN